MLFSIIVLSYNRPTQVARILENLVSSPGGDFNLIIKDDCSPRQGEIEDVVNSYRGRAGIDIVLHKNETNLGYDRNLLDAFSVTEASYVFLLSDDDYIDGGKLSQVSAQLSKRDFKVYFSPYLNDGVVSRSIIRPYRLDEFHSVIYNSILFSGLVFDRQAVLSLVKDEQFLSSSIYTQVYIASLLVFNEKKFGVIPGGVLYLGGDGENYFGKNNSATNKELLRDRESVTANLKYQSLLLKVVVKISEATDASVLVTFKREFNRRLISYLLSARASGLPEFRELVECIENMRFEVSWYVKFAMRALVPFPAGLATGARKLGLRLLKKSG